MQHNNDEQREYARRNARRLIEEAEEKRAQKRLERALQNIYENDLRILENSEIQASLAKTLYSKFIGGEHHTVITIIDNMFFQCGKKQYHDLVLPVVDEICSMCLQGCNIRLMEYLCSSLTEELSKKEPDLDVTETIRHFLGQSCCAFVRSSRWQNFERLISALWKIRHREYRSSQGTQEVFQDVFVEIAVKDVIEKLVQYHNSGTDDARKLVRKCIRYLGEEAILYLLNRLVFSKSKDERFLLIKLLASTGDELVTPIKKFMEEDLPWYAVRNLIGLISELGNPEYYSIVESYLIHPDLRVQQQVLSCIVKLAGKNMDKRLIQALPVVDDELKLKLIMQLGEYGSEEIANGLIDIIYKSDTFSRNIREELLYKTCITLRSYPYTKVVNLLKYLLKEKKDAGARLCVAVEETINFLEPQIKHRVKEEERDNEYLNFGLHSKDNGNEGLTDIDDFTDEIDSLLQLGKVEKATALMYKKIVDLARAKDFHSAELIRDMLLESNPDALQDVIRASEIIEEEQNSPTHSVQFEMWDDLLKTLSSAEYECIISCLHTEHYKKDEKIVSAGEIDPCLYFINSGSVRLSCICGSREVFLKRLKPGDVLGVAPFFSASVWTVNITASQETSVQVIGRDSFLSGSRKHPELEEKLADFCKSKENVRKLVTMSGSDRRDSARYPVSVTFTNVLLDRYGEREGRRTFKSEMLDISRGGMSFSIRISSTASAGRLLGRQVVSEIKLKDKRRVQCLGVVVSIQHLHEIAKEYSVHVKFYKELEQQQVTDILNMAFY